MAKSKQITTTATATLLTGNSGHKSHISNWPVIISLSNKQGVYKQLQ